VETQKTTEAAKSELRKRKTAEKRKPNQHGDRHAK
jgi:hypothetical protein